MRYNSAVPLPTQVSVTPTTPSVSWNSGAPLAFTLTRTGDVSQPLTVVYTVAGIAQNGVDYQPLSGAKKIKAGETSATIKVHPLPNGTNNQGEKVLKFTLIPDDENYLTTGKTTVKGRIVPGS